MFVLPNSTMELSAKNRLSKIDMLQSRCVTTKTAIHDASLLQHSTGHIFLYTGISTHKVLDSQCTYNLLIVPARASDTGSTRDPSSVVYTGQTLYWYTHAVLHLEDTLKMVISFHSLFVKHERIPIRDDGMCPRQKRPHACSIMVIDLVQKNARQPHSF